MRSRFEAATYWLGTPLAIEVLRDCKGALLDKQRSSRNRAKATKLGWRLAAGYGAGAHGRVALQFSDGRADAQALHDCQIAEYRDAIDKAGV